MDGLLARHTQMKADTFDAVREDQQVNKYRALNTYKIKLCSTHAENYVVADATENPNTISASKGNNNPTGGLRWRLPAIQGNHINNALIKVVNCHIPASCYNYAILKDHSGNLEMDFSTTTFTKNDLVYFQSSNVVDKTFVSSPNGSVIRKAIIGSKNISPLYKAHSAGGAIKDPTLIEPIETSNTGVIDNDYVLCSNPFGSTLNLEIITPDEFTAPPIENSRTGDDDLVIGASATNNSIIDNPIVWELEIKLLPDNQSNDKFSY